MRMQTVCVVLLLACTVIDGRETGFSMHWRSSLVETGVPSQRKILKEVPDVYADGAELQWGCDHQCVNLTGKVADRCAWWHQVVVGFGYRQPPFNIACANFLTSVDICILKQPIAISCSPEGRVMNISGMRTGPQNMQSRLLPLLSVMDQLRRIYLNEMGLTGTLPSEWGRLDNLKGIRLLGNNLSGTLPTAWGTLSKLEEFQLGKNHLEGTLPPEWGGMRAIEFFDLSDNQLCGTLPASWGKMMNMLRLHLPRNHLEGTLPPEWGAWRRVKYLVLDHNNFTSTLPSEWGGMLDVVWLDVAFNPLLRGHIPYGLLLVTLTQNRPTEGDVMRLPRQFLPLVLHTPYKPFRVILTNGTAIRMPNDGKLHQRCQQGQKHQWTLYITEGNSMTFWCGKTWRPEVQLAILWGVFGLVLLGLGIFKRWHWTRRAAGSSSSSSSSSSRVTSYSRGMQTLISVRTFWNRYLHVPVRVTMSVIDLVTDLILVLSMFPSWTFYVLLVGLVIPEIVCSGALVVNMLPSLACYYPLWAVLPLALLLFVGLATTLPLLIIAFTIYTLWRKGSFRYFQWGRAEVRVDKILELHSGVTACSEDVLSTVFSSVALYMMSISPLDAVMVRIYFPVWAFWIRVPPAMLHMAVAFWQALGNYLERGNFSWVREAFKDIYIYTINDVGNKDVVLELPGQWPGT